jgi:hypothetical protein
MVLERDSLEGVFRFDFVQDFLGCGLVIVEVRVFFIAGFTFFIPLCDEGLLPLTFR